MCHAKMLSIYPTPQVCLKNETTCVKFYSIFSHFTFLLEGLSVLLDFKYEENLNLLIILFFIMSRATFSHEALEKIMFRNL